MRLAQYNRLVYSPELLDHFQNPRNAGELESPDAIARRENPVCGDILELSIKLGNAHSESKSTEANCVVEIRFRAKGCVPTMACGSAITELIKGKNIEDARRVTREELIQKIGGLPPASDHASHLALDTLSALLRKV
jgi:nitrogen fixation NifU-like protein